MDFFPKKRYPVDTARIREWIVFRKPSLYNNRQLSDLRFSGYEKIVEYEIILEYGGHIPELA